MNGKVYIHSCILMLQTPATGSVVFFQADIKHHHHPLTERPAWIFSTPPKKGAQKLGTKRSRMVSMSAIG
jgi:hypothetical protein